MTRAMKDSGIEWIVGIPEEWEVKPTLVAFKERKVKNAGNVETNLLSLSYGRIIRKDASNNMGLLPESFENYNIIESGNIVFRLTDLQNDHVSLRSALVMERGIITSAYVTLESNIKLSARYYNYLFRSYDNCKVFYNMGGGVRQGINYNELKKIPLLIPPYSKQQTIADYLDRKCMLIDSTIENQKSVIGKLKLYKQAVITEAVTKGLDRTVKIKPTGIEWIGEIPKGWEVGQLKFFATIRSGITLGKKYASGTQLVEYPYLRVANVQGGYTDLTDVATILITEEEAQKHKLQVGEVLMTEGGDRDKLGRGCIWYGKIENCLHQNHIFAVRTEESKLDAKFFDYITTSDVGRNYFDFTAKKTTNLASTNSTTILEFRFPVPRIDEQKEIISYLDTKCSQTDAIIAGKQKLIDKLTDYKKSLIYECVTGKREVV